MLSRPRAENSILAAMATDLQSALGGRYIIERELGRGGMGTVYLARDVRLDRPIALKVLPAEYAQQHALRERFVRETRTAAGFSHPNIVPVYGVEESEHLLAYAMAFVEGETLTDRVKRAGPLPVREVVRLLQDVGYALAYAHGRGVVHRDIKPDNIMIERATGRALVMDFGIARVMAGAAPVSSTQAGLTRVGEVVGTPEYMSPEQATGDHVDGRSDLYSLGLAAYFALTGRPAVRGDTTGQVLARQITEPLPDIRVERGDVPAPLVQAIEHCTAKDPAGRFPNAEALVEAIDAARLSGPVIPLAVRIFAQELGALSMALVGGAFAAFIMIRAMSNGSMGDLSLIMVLLFSVVLTRVLQTMREAGRLASAGFTPDDVHQGLTAVLAEREQRREELRADPATRKARRTTLIAASIMLVGGVVLFRAAMMFRFEIAPGRYNVRPPGGFMVVGALIMLGVSLALLGRSPFRAPLGERLFRLVWLGPLGRAFVRFASRGRSGTGAARGASTGRSKVVTRVPSPNGAGMPAAARGGGGDDRLAALEARVVELERWRKTSS